MATGSDSDGSTGEGSIGRNVERNWRGETWSNATHASVTDPQARLYRKAKGRPAQLCYMGHAMTENRCGFVVATELTHADGTAERRAALAMIERASPGRVAQHASGMTRRITIGADKGYDDRGFVTKLRQMCVTPHVAAKSRRSAIDARTTRHAGYATSSEEAQAGRGAVRLGQDGRADRQGHAARPEPRRRPVQADHGRLQSRPAAETAKEAKRTMRGSAEREVPFQTASAGSIAPPFDGFSETC